MLKFKLRGVAVACAISVGVPLVAMAGAKAATVQEIVQRGSVKIGVLVGSPPVGMVDASGNLSGYDIDVANALGQLLGVKTELVPLTAPNRIPALLAGKVDFDVATLNPLPARALTVAFSIPYEGFKATMVTRKDASIASYADLHGKRIGLTRGSDNDARLQKLTDKYGFTLVRYDDDATTVQAIQSGQIDAGAMPDAVIYPIMRDRPDANLKVAFDIALSYNSLAVRPDDMNLLQWLNTAINYLKVNGDLNAISQKWIGVDLPTLPTF